MSDSERILGKCLRRFDARLDAYLRRSLSPEDHERISTSVECVASLTDDIQLKHRYAILGHKCIYLAELPPKNLKVAVHHRDILSVEMLNDLPTFLKPKVGENTVHIQVRYHKKSKEKSHLLSSIAKRSPLVFRRTKTESATTSTNPHTPPSSPASDSNKIYPWQRSKSLSPRSPLVQHSATSPQQSRPLPNLDLNGSPSTGSSAHVQLPVFDAFIHGSSNSINMSSENDKLSASRSSTSLFAEVPARLMADHRSHSTSTLQVLGSSVRPRSSSSNDLSGSSHLTEPRKQYHSSHSLHYKLGLEQESVTGDKSELGLMNLYILKPVSDFYHQLCVAWDNWNIQQLCVSADTQKHSQSPLQRDHFSQRYMSLKQELLNCSGNLEKAARLALELSTAAQRYSVIKPLFWEDCEMLLDFWVKQLEAHFNLSSTSQYSKADKIEYSVILMDLLYQMLKESYHLKRKVVVLTRNSGCTLLSLATVLVSHLFQSTDPELASLVSEVIEKSSGILYELLQVCLQTKWPEADKSSISVSKVVDDLVKLHGMAGFLDQMTAYMREVIGPRSGSIDAMKGKDQVSLHHMSFVLHTFLQHCSTGSFRLLRTHLVDNFRYYISVSRVKQVLSESNPLSRKTISFLEKIKSKIL